MESSSAVRTPPAKGVVVLLGGLAVLLAGYTVITLGSVGSSGLQDAFGRWAYDSIVLGAAGAVLLRAVLMPTERAAWLSLGTALLLWALGQTYYSIFLYYASPAPVPSPSDAFFLAFYPASYLALVLLLRARSKRVGSFAWVDALIVGLAVAAVAAALIFPPVLEALDGSTLGASVNLAYPCADLVLLGLVAAAITTAGWRRHGTWLLIAAALVLFGISDVVYLSVGGQSTEALNAASIGWPLAFLLLAWAAWLPSAAMEPTPDRSANSIALPIALATVVIGLLAVGSFVSIDGEAVGLGVASLLARKSERIMQTAREERQKGSCCRCHAYGGHGRRARRWRPGRWTRRRGYESGWSRRGSGSECGRRSRRDGGYGSRRPWHGRRRRSPWHAPRRRNVGAGPPALPTRTAKSVGGQEAGRP